MTARVVVVGASAAGLSVAEALRDEDFEGSVTLIGAEDHLPYDRPPLSKGVLSGALDLDGTLLRSADEIDRLGIDLRLGVRATGLDRAAGYVRTSTGEDIAYDRLVIATGVVPRRLPVDPAIRNVFTLRTIEDARGIRDALGKSRRLVVVGAGVLGCEIAAAAARMGIEVVIVDALAAPMLRQLGPEAGGRIRALHEAHGNGFRLGAAVAKVTADKGAVSGVVLGDGSALAADMVVVAIGSRPATAWLEGSGLDLSDGVVCDEYCRAAENVYAAGDVASWMNPRFSARMRIEHRTNAAEQGMCVAANIAGRPTPFDPVPFFWSDQFDTRIQAYGRIDADARPHVAWGDPDQGRFVLAYVKDGCLAAVLAWNAARHVRDYPGRIGAVFQIADRGLVRDETGAAERMRNVENSSNILT